MEIGTGEFLIIPGVSQGLFFAILLLTSKKYKSHPNQFLALALIILALIILKVGELVKYDVFTEIFEYFAIEYLLPALLFFYVTTSLKEKINAITCVLLLGPFIIFSLIRTLISIADLQGYEALGTVLEQVEYIELYAIALFVFIIAIRSIQKVKKSNSDPVFKKWIYMIFSAFMILIVSLLTSELVEALFDLDYWVLSWVGASMFLMGISYFGVQQLNIEQQIKKIRDIQIEKRTPLPQRQDRSSTNHFDRLQHLMTDQELFKDPNLSRETLASSMGLSASSITRVLKENSGQSFNDFINHYRIALAKDMLDDARFDIFSLEAIGKDVGFKSRSAFYETFKKLTGLTPGGYKKR